MAGLPTAGDQKSLMSPAETRPVATLEKTRHHAPRPSSVPASPHRDDRSRTGTCGLHGLRFDAPEPEPTARRTGPGRRTPAAHDLSVERALTRTCRPVRSWPAPATRGPDRPRPAIRASPAQRQPCLQPPGIDGPRNARPHQGRPPVCRQARGARRRCVQAAVQGAFRAAGADARLVQLGHGDALIGGQPSVLDAEGCHEECRCPKCRGRRFLAPQPSRHARRGPLSGSRRRGTCVARSCRCPMPRAAPR